MLKKCIFNENAADTTNVEELRQQGGLGLNLTGYGVKVAVIDADQVLSTHEQFNKHQLSIYNTNSRITIDPTNIDAPTFHATHVAGTIGASGYDSGTGDPGTFDTAGNGETKRGMAPDCLIRSYSFYGNDFNSSGTGFWSTDASSNHFDISNHSYGAITGWFKDNGPDDRYEWYGDLAIYATTDADTIVDGVNIVGESSWFGRYSTTTRNIDKDAFNNNTKLMFWAVGNDRNEVRPTAAFSDFTVNNGQTYAIDWTTDPNNPTFDVNQHDLANGPNIIPIPPADNFNAKNNQIDTTNTGYDTITSHAVSKNTLCVGSILDITAEETDIGGRSITINDFSNFGPIDDGRIKPDVVGNGNFVYSCSNGNDTAYGNASGTSMATPNVCGTAALLLEHYRDIQNNNIANILSATFKGLLCLTAFRDSPGPTYGRGYGVVDGGKAATFLSNSNRYISPTTVTLTVTITNSKFNINGIEQRILKLRSGLSYIFDVSGVVGNHPFKFSTTLNGNLGGGGEYTDGVSSGTGTITLDTSNANTPTSLYYYCPNHSGMGNSISIIENTLNITVDNNNKFVVDGVSQKNIKLRRNKTYVFDQSNATNATHPLRFSTTNDGTHGGGVQYTTGVTPSGTPGTAGAKVTITTAANVPLTLYYYCSQHAGMGGTGTIKMEQNHIEENNNYRDNNNSYNLTVFNESNPVKVTLVWNDFTDNSSFISSGIDDPTSNLTNRLKVSAVKVGDATDIKYPWKLDKSNPINAATKNSENTIDNVQLIEFTPDAGAAYTVNITSVAPVNVAQPYSIVVENGTLSTSDVTAPTVSAITTTTVSGSYKAGEVIPISVQFDEIVTVTGTPQLTLNTTAVVDYVSGDGTDTLLFNYTVGSGQNTSGLNYNATNSLVLNGGSIQDAATNNANLTLPASSGLVNGKTIVIDTTASTVTGVTTTTSAGTYSTGIVIPISIVFSENVNVTGTPQLTLNTTPAAVVDYDSGSGTNTLLFNYTVGAGQSSVGLNYNAIDSLALNGGSILDVATNVATLTLPSLASSGLKDGKTIIIDTTSINVNSVTTTTSAGSYSTGVTIPISVEFSGVVVVTDTPRIILNTTPQAHATYSSGSNSNILIFNYLVEAGQNVSTLNYTTTTALELNSGTIKSNGGDDATLTLPAVPAGGLDSKVITIDTGSPTISSVTTSQGDATLQVGQGLDIIITFTETVILTGVPQLELNVVKMNGTVNTYGIASYVHGSNSTQLTFTYDVDYGFNIDTLNYKATDSLTLNGGTITDTANNNATLTLPSLPSPGLHSKTIKIDTEPIITSILKVTEGSNFNTGDTVDIAINFSEPVTLSGGDLILTLDTGGTVTISSISNSNTATGTYTVQSSDTSTGLSVSNVALSAGSLSDGGGAAMGDFSVPVASNLNSGGSSISINFVPCLFAGTIIKTDQGNLPIEDLNTNNTIRGIKIRAISKNRAKKEEIVKIPKNWFSKNKPNRSILITKAHNICKGNYKLFPKGFIRAGDFEFSDLPTGLTKEYYDVYHISFGKLHSWYLANNLPVDSLNPRDMFKI